MIKFAAQAGAIDERNVVLESLGAIKRAGADLIFSYFALDLAEQNLLVGSRSLAMRQRVAERPVLTLLRVTFYLRHGNVM